MDSVGDFCFGTAVLITFTGHWGIASTGQYYNGVKHEDITTPGYLDNGIHCETSPRRAFVLN